MAIGSISENYIHEENFFKITYETSTAKKHSSQESWMLLSVEMFTGNDGNIGNVMKGNVSETLEVENVWRSHD